MSGKSQYQILLFYCCVINGKGKRMHKIWQHTCITLFNPGLTGFLLKEDKAKKKWWNNKPLIQCFG